MNIKTQLCFYVLTVSYIEKGQSIAGKAPIV